MTILFQDSPGAPRSARRLADGVLRRVSIAPPPIRMQEKRRRSNLRAPLRGDRSSKTSLVLLYPGDGARTHWH